MMISALPYSFIWAVSLFSLSNSPSVETQFGNIIHDWKVSDALLWTGFITTALTCYGENVAMRDLDAAESTVIYATEPLWGTTFAAITLGEEIGWNTLIGAILILGACLWNRLRVKQVNRDLYQIETTELTVESNDSLAESSADRLTAQLNMTLSHLEV